MNSFYIRVHLRSSAVPYLFLFSLLSPEPIHHAFETRRRLVQVLIRIPFIHREDHARLEDLLRIRTFHRAVIDALERMLGMIERAVLGEQRIVIDGLLNVMRV